MSEHTKVVKFDNNTQVKGVIDDGTREIPIENRFGKLICKIYIRPGDLSIIDRYNKVIKDLPGIIKPLKDLSIKNDGTASLDKDWEALKQVEEELYKQLNYLFDMDEAADIFATRNPFSAIRGRFFCESIIEVIGNIISEAITEEAERVERRTNKYLNDLKEIQARPEEAVTADGTPDQLEVDSNVGKPATDA